MPGHPALLTLGCHSTSSNGAILANRYASTRTISASTWRASTAPQRRLTARYTRMCLGSFSEPILTRPARSNAAR